MIRIRCIQSSYGSVNNDRIEQVKDLFKEAFPEFADKAERIRSILKRPFKYGYSAALILLERGMGRVDAFAFVLHFPDCKSAFLDYIAVRKTIRGGGLGTTLYEAVREYCLDVGAQSLYFEVQPDTPELTPDPDILDEARKRVRFYEHYGARTIINPAYSAPLGNPPTTAFLMFDGLGRTDPLMKNEVRDAVKVILTRRFAKVSSPQYVRKIIESFSHDPVRFLPMRYAGKSLPSYNIELHRMDRKFLLISSQKHVIHHVKQRGYFERPMRVGVLQESLSHTGMFNMIDPMSFPESVITAVHDRYFFEFLKTICNKLEIGKPVYPDTFPIRRADRRPKMFPEQAGYYCIDSCTPLDGNAYAAARASVNVAMTGAEKILSGRRVVYSLCRPPGHHAERRVYGGFCYFNNAAIAANHLAKQVKTAILDIDYHHGNGTQDIFYERSDVLTVSIHGHPNHAFPYFSGFTAETGSGQGLGFNLNLPLPMESDETAYLPMLDRALRAIHKFKPEVLVVSLGLDILRGDPTGTFKIDPSSMNEIGARLNDLNISLLIIQEGGYNLRGIKKGVAEFFKGLRRFHHDPS